MLHKIELQDVSQSFSSNTNQIELFNSLNLTLIQGQSYSITGPSGAGKSSLLLLASGLEAPTTGAVNYLTNSRTMAMEQVRKNVGFIFQQFNLLPELTALSNVALPLKLRGDKNAIHKAKDWLSKVGLSHRLDHKPDQLSGGEQQRVAIARALIFEPKFIFADEPTGNLDPKSGKQIAELLLKCCKENNAGLIIVTHSSELADKTQHSFSLADGALCQTRVTQLEAVSC